MFDFKQLTKELYSAVLSDVLDECGFKNQALRPFIRPVDDTLTFMGRARTGLFVDTYSVKEGENPYEIEIKLLDDLKPCDVPVLACNGPTDRIAPWGELLTTASMARGAVGCVTDGLVRDLRQIRELKFPVFHGGIGPLDSRGRARMVEMDTVVECAGVTVISGDLVFGDIDGVVIIPQQHAETIIKRARQKVAAEDHTRDELRQGSLLGEVYDKYGVL
ncbi:MULTISPECIES: RraA family protein [unclassified Rhizobium]|uniref:RraA family protein n=1 Tax=unclassified Rhizobium TaxID=2613769 RepID=UPI00178698A3|nr:MULTISPECIES: RraA family protein [unclassified Rhizobium]MBD8688843.1 RraA family protein [Rhizobium sp. CFBP 13644]MBD8694186.1 RraA family protein [Rhizobium sp. CFBP 13717]